MSEWRPIGTAPDKRDVQTCIINSKGEERNNQVMQRQGRLWYVSGSPGSMYVYYNPTHWKPIE